ncbi:cell division cycle-associated protein 4-like isoform X2 [Scleropages formosus]|uniref:cell division cycle-associated protein 4-like isoform X2 n=1 Tax=Scleropages formosus TaxID=113540 RepID=UPI000878FA28|nr:cell division cycle-associated protein 4-like isoform X2 [Scleropages formosus]
MGQRDVFYYETSMRIEKGIRRAPLCRLDAEPDGDHEAQRRGSGGDLVLLPSSRCLLGRGVKRKLSDTEEALGSLPYLQQRQLVLDLCLNKLNSCHTRPEVSLHRSVLLANTLRHIQEEMQQEGKGSILLDPPASGPTLPQSSDGSSTCTGYSEGEVLSCSLSLEESFGSFEITNSTSYLTDMQLDDIFEDIDTSMYDSCDFSALPIPLTRGGISQSLVLDDGLKMFSSCTSSSALQLYFSDLSDLDHIMEILVRS